MILINKKPVYVAPSSEVWLPPISRGVVYVGNNLKSYYNEEFRRIPLPRFSNLNEINRWY